MGKASNTLIQTGDADFPKSERVLKGHEFRYLKENGKPTVGKMMVLSHAKAPDGKRRLGIIVTRKFNKRAVKRNRAYRIIREAYRLIKESVKEDTWLVIIARKHLHGKTAADVQTELLYLLENEKLVENIKDDK
ncbi:MAG: ribonuclease P protein component [Lentisphaeraceae bacterium]|nr:ribonuclease P protein component [Lentisphaeraceae bacterium]